MHETANLAVRFSAVRSIATGKVREYIGSASEMLEANLVSTDGGQKGSNTWTGRKFASAKLLQGLNAGLAIGQNAGTVLGLDYEGAKVLYGSCYRQRFDLTW